MTSQGDKAIKAEISHRLEQYKRTPLSTPLGAQERRRQAALEVRRRRRDASYSAARGLDAVDDLALPDSDDLGLDDQPASSKANKKKNKQKQQKSSPTSFANVLQQAELLDSLPEDLDENWMALPWIPSGRRVLARVDWDARYGEDRMTLYSRRRGEAINPASSGQSRTAPQTQSLSATTHTDAGQEEDNAAHTTVMVEEDVPSYDSSSSTTAAADLQLPTDFASGPSSTMPFPHKPPRKRRGGRSSRSHASSNFSIPLSQPLPRGTELDCVFTPRSSTLWALDIRSWGTSTDLRECDAEFRLYWLEARLSELDPPMWPAHFPADSLRGEERMLDGTGPFAYPFIIKALPVVAAPVRGLEEWKRRVLDVCRSQNSPDACSRTKVRRIITATAAAPESGEMDVDRAGVSAPTLVTLEALLIAPGPHTPTSDGILLYHREGGYVEGEAQTPLAAWVPTCATEAGGMDVTKFERLLEERDKGTASSAVAVLEEDKNLSGGMET
ncbi:hypothetical protein BDZ90DRAFT_258267 [Jaminaea rosea]|uniref:Snurportin-1 n=1 Tax=Jaminaea rosea TaxID=1569628 RepID=A0A316UVK2_9BASI|nr:hypothetical protein BDZ90DRAFT_258267 [Jaminaea rosea]PWN29327.1 hypothetical protein BDZ90DRAFT_258267 [Jaminaea rosea]